MTLLRASNLSLLLHCKFEDSSERLNSSLRLEYKIMSPHYYCLISQLKEFDYHHSNKLHLSELKENLNFGLGKNPHIHWLFVFNNFRDEPSSKSNLSIDINTYDLFKQL